MLNFIEIIIGETSGTFVKCLMYIFSIIIPILIIILEEKGYIFTEIVYTIASKFLMIIGDNKAAKAILLKLVEKHPNSYLGHVLLAKIYEKEGGMRRAIDEYALAIDCNTKDYNSYYKIAELLNDLGKKDEAIEMLQNLVSNKPEYYEASILLGDLLCEKERFKEAVSVYTDALRYKPADYDLYYNLGIAYTRLNDFSSAKECYEKAAEINHKLHNAKYNLGQIALIEKDLEDAEKYFEECLLDEELEAKAYYQLAKIAMLKEEKDKAILFANKAIELDESYLKIITKEELFEPIKKYITVSVKMNDEHENKKEPKKLGKREEEVQKYLEDTYILIKDLNENEVKNRINAKLDNIFKQEEVKRIKKEAERNVELESEESLEIQKEKDY